MRILVSLAAFAAMAAFASHELDPAGAAESSYLAVLATAVLLAVATLAPRPAAELGAGAVLSTAAVWTLPPGPGRGATVLLILVASLALAVLRRLRETLPALPVEVAVPLALGVQFLLRGGMLFGPEPSLRKLVALVALPVAGGIATAVLARRHGGGLALLAAGTAVLLAPGWNVAATLALLALAAGDLLAWPELNRPAKALAFLLLLAPIAWEPGPGLGAAGAGLVLSHHPMVATAVALGVYLGWRSPLEGAGEHGLVLLLVLVPAVVRLERNQLGRLLPVAILCAVMPRVPDVSTLTAPLALTALLLRREGATTVLQRLWTGFLLAGTALLASYPWLRDEPLREALRLLGPPEPLAPIVPAVFFLLAFAGDQMADRPRRRVRPAALAAGLLFLALLLRLPAPGRLLLPAEVAVVLDTGRPVWEAELPSGPVGNVVVESALANASGLANGTPVAIVRLDASLEWTLRAGEETGEWAARRPDVMRSARLRSPRAWVSWVSEEFFAQRYRARWRMEEPGRFTRVRIERASGLPPEVSLAVHQVEIRR